MDNTAQNVIESDEVQITVRNRFEDCVRLGLIPKGPIKEKLCLHIDIEFSESWETLTKNKFFVVKKDWRINFGLKAGELGLTLENLSSPPSQRNFKIKLPYDQEIMTEVTRSQEVSELKQKSSNPGIHVGLDKASLSIKENNVSARQSKDRVTTKDVMTRNIVRIQSKGNVSTPKWSFELTTSDPFIIGGIEDWLADLDIGSRPYKLTAVFKTSINDISIHKIDGMEYFDSTLNKRAVIKRMLQKNLFKLFGDPISTVEIKYEH